MKPVSQPQLIVTADGQPVKPATSRTDPDEADNAAL